jgi:hypothetical protein
MTFLFETLNPPPKKTHTHKKVHAETVMDVLKEAGVVSSESEVRVCLMCVCFSGVCVFFWCVCVWSGLERVRGACV